jgi:hypothetical protein
MNELKTLKDFKGFDHILSANENYWEDENGELVDMDKVVSFKQLRVNAIKDIEALKNFKKTSDDELWEILTGNTITYSEEGKQAVINYIKWKCNITDKDIHDFEEEDYGI